MPTIVAPTIGNHLQIVGVYIGRRGILAQLAVALTNRPQRAGIPLTLEMSATQLPRPSWVRIRRIRTLSVQRIGRRLGEVSPQEMAQVIEALNGILNA